MKKSHNFIKMDASEIGAFNFVIACTYCGLVSYNGRNTDNKDKQEKAAEGCPCAPEEVSK